MSDAKKPDPVDDLKKGVGLLFRAARHAVEDLPTGKLEEVVKTGVREVGRAIENVADTIDKQLFKKDSAPPAASPDAPPPPPYEPAAPSDAPRARVDADAPSNEPPAPPRGPHDGEGI